MILKTNSFHLIVTIFVILINLLIAPSFAGGDDKAGGSNSNEEVSQESKTPVVSPETAIRDYTVNLTAAQETQGIPKALQRQGEIARINGAIKNGESVWLIGESGAGKSYLAESLVFEGKTVLSLEIGKLEAGAKFRGDLEARIVALLGAISVERGETTEYVLFIDEVHRIMELDKVYEALKPLLANEQIQIIGGTTESEMREKIENKDSAVANRGQKVEISVPTEEMLVTFLRESKAEFYSKFLILPTDAALVEVAKSAIRYFSDQAPARAAKALLKEALEAKRSELNGEGDKRAQLDKQIEVLVKEKESKQIDRNNSVNMEANDTAIAGIEIKLKSLRSQVAELQSSIVDLDQIKLLRADLKGLSERVAALPDDSSESSELFFQFSRKEEELVELMGDSAERWQLSIKDVRRSTAIKTGLALKFIEATPAERLDLLETILNSEVVGLKSTIETIIDVLGTRESGVLPSRGPIANFLFAGATGTGKTFLADLLGEHYLGRILTLTGENYGQKHQVDALFGSPVGYEGNKKGGTLTEPIRLFPHTVVFFDEFEKAHHSIYEILLTIMDKGIGYDSIGRRISFKNTVLVIGTNLGKDYALIRDTWEPSAIEKRFEMEEGELEGLSLAARDTAVMKHIMVKRGMPDTFAARFTELFVFDAVTKISAREIAVREAQKVIDHNLEENGITVVISEKAIKAVANSGFSRRYGARNVRAEVEALIGRVLKNSVIRAGAGRGDTVDIDVINDDTLPNPPLRKGRALRLVAKVNGTLVVVDKGRISSLSLHYQKAMSPPKTDADSDEAQNVETSGDTCPLSEGSIQEALEAMGAE